MASASSWPAPTPMPPPSWTFGEARSRVEGFIPTGWYPTAVRGLANGTLVILNGKGLRSYPNAENGPNPRSARTGARR